MELLQGKSIVVTGASGGLGGALCASFLKRGARVAALDLAGPSDVPETGELRRYDCDVTDEAQVQAVLGRVQQELGGIDVLVNNAGITSLSRFEDEAKGRLERVMGVNFFGAVHCTRAALPALKAARGSVAAISSVAGFAPLFGRTAYVASKHALQGFFETLRSEVEDDGVHVLVVCPAFIDTGIHAKAGGPGRQAIGHSALASPGAYAERISEAISARRDRLLLGKDAWLSSLVWPLAPRFYLRTMKRRVAANFKGK